MPCCEPETGDPIRRHLELIPWADRAEGPREKRSVARPVRSDVREVISAPHSRQVLHNHCRNCDVVHDSESLVIRMSPSLREKQDVCSGVAVAFMKSKSGVIRSW